MGCFSQQLRPHYPEVLTANPRAVMRFRLRWLLIRVVQAYQRHLSTHFRGRCMYEPSCSKYAIEALERYGSLRGAALTAQRLIRCRPPYEGGCDPVP